MDIQDRGPAPYLRAEDGVLLTAPEAERLVDQLQPFDVDDVGSMAWLQQHDVLEKLNIQAHHNALAHADEFVMAALVSYDKLALLVHELLVIEVWKDQVYPLIAAELAQGGGSINVYLVLHHEATLANLLEVALFHREACEAAGEDALLELADFCHRKMVYLHAEGRQDASFKERSAAELLALSPAQELQDKAAAIRFGVALCCLTLLRYLTDYLPHLPLCVMARLLTTHDCLMTLVPLLLSPPWQRRRVHHGSKLVEGYVDGRWQAIPPADRAKLQQPDAQAWLAVTNLLVEPGCRAKYRFDDFRRDVVLKLKPRLTPALHDQLPVLRDLHRVLEELTLMQTPATDDMRASRLILEQVPEMRERLLRRTDWAILGRAQLGTVFRDTPETRADTQSRMADMLAMFEFEEMLEAPKCASCGSDAAQRCSSCKSDWYCGRDCQLNCWPTHKELCGVLVKGAK
ncbi:hypothetical protein KFL_003580010 [Klebsormidium nitens]|uniref:MYND-type domain-containing protein n=1 Tax=Klebsormidium nitens TaxID=105231 RepID=A0A1Y1IFK0_KLENI|nr:hypothetical protein KFL_003580010 [Klebsormidium nitens]|eukprot:GAQ87507.1 hypothetical protein KFL_003580010 [Klebsormidium nitens]